MYRVERLSAPFGRTSVLITTSDSQTRKDTEWLSRWLFRILLLLLLLLLFGSATVVNQTQPYTRDDLEYVVQFPLSAQQKPTLDQDAIVTSTNLVTVNVLVTDQGGYLSGLTRDDFQLKDEGVLQQISHFSRENDPVSVGTVLEITNRNSQNTRAMLSCLRWFSTAMNNGDDFFFMAFGKGGSVTTTFVPTLEQLDDHLTVVRPSGPSSLYDAVFAAAARMRTMPNLKKALLIISDGQDHNSITSYESLRNRLRQFDVQIYAIGLSRLPNASGEARRWVFADVTRNNGWRPMLADPDIALGRAVFGELSRVSGGTSYFPEVENEPQLMRICTQIAVELRKQYTLGFYPTSTSSSRQPHRLNIAVKTALALHGLSLSYRTKYEPFANSAK